MVQMKDNSTWIKLVMWRWRNAFEVRMLRKNQRDLAITWSGTIKGSGKEAPNSRLRS